MGLAVAERIISQGGKAAILDINEAQGSKVADKYPDQILFSKTDISKEEDVDNAVDIAAKEFGHINLAVGCAGVLGAGRLLSKQGPMSLEHFQTTVNINLIGTFLLTRAVAKHMQSNPLNSKNEAGVIIHTASIAAYEGQLGQVAYSATKAAIVGMMLPLAREFAKFKVRCMAIAPGMFETPMMAGVSDKIRESLCEGIPFPSRFGTTEEFAKMVEHINDNQMLNGSVIRLDGAARLQ